MNEIGKLSKLEINEVPEGPSGGGEGLPPAVLAAGLEILKESMRCFTEYQKAKEHEKTERQRIKAYMKVLLEKINSDKETYLEVFRTCYRERQELYTMAQEQLKVATEERNLEMIRLSYSFILAVYKGGDKRTMSRMSLGNDMPKLL